ncbi:tail fiber protein [Histophilus somni]|uniref:tail fiber protein n=1 Tax=Histophilus somni TaxID=731 RepID=UPI00201E82C3|nr:tail fiber protein [Histophilus somni]
MIDNKTQHYEFPLPDKNNLLSEDVERIKNGLIKIDEVIHGITIPDASLTQAGKVQLSSDTESDNEDKAATPKAVKQVKEIANRKVSKTGNEDIRGTKSFLDKTWFKKQIAVSGNENEANANNYASWGANGKDSWWMYKRDNQIIGTLRIESDGTLTYEKSIESKTEKRHKIFHEGNKPTWTDIQNVPHFKPTWTDIQNVPHFIDATNKIIELEQSSDKSAWLSANQSAFNLATQDILAMSVLANSVTAMSVLANSSTALNAVVNSSTAMNAVANSSTAMSAVVNSSTALSAVVNSSTALNAVVNSSTAMNAVVNSSTAMNAVVNSATALSAVVNSSTALNAVVNSSTAMNAVVNSATAMNAVVNSSTAMNAVVNSSTAMNAVVNSATAMNAVVKSSTAMSAVVKSYTARNTFMNNNTLFQQIKRELWEMVQANWKRKVTQRQDNVSNANNAVANPPGLVFATLGYYGRKNENNYYTTLIHQNGIEADSSGWEKEPNRIHLDSFAVSFNGCTFTEKGNGYVYCELWCPPD